MRSEGNYFICEECGTKLRYTEEGFFAGENCIFDSVLDWSIWQNDRIKEKCNAESDEPIFVDSDLELHSVSTAENKKLLACGTMKLFRDRLELPDGTVIGVHNISGMSILGAQNLYFSSNNQNFLITSKKVRCTSKYLTACKIFDKSLQYGI